MGGFDPETLEFYAEQAPVYTSSGSDGVARHLPEFCELLPTGAVLLELGCGGGYDGKRGPWLKIIVRKAG
ncbi:MAG: hypothetical protein V3V15_11960 [Sphingorhabdus sp.]